MTERDAKEREPSSADLTSELAALREAIDAVDAAILERLNERARLVQQVGERKRPHRSPVYVASRERDLVAALEARNRGPFPNEGLAPVFREIISATRSLEEVMRVAYLGPEGTFSHEAALKQFGALVELVPSTTIREVVTATERGQVDFGVVPVENTIEGAVTQTFDALVESQVTLCGELLLAVRQNLLAQGVGLDGLVRVASHPQPLAQCRGWLERHLPGIEVVETPSTGAAAQLAADDPTCAAIGSEVAAEVYGLCVVECGVEDQRENTTRFGVIGREVPEASGDDLTSAVFTVRKDQSGALHQLLEPFARYGVNLSSIQSRPMKGKPWEYLFFVDMEGHASDAIVGKALEEAASVAHSAKVLGSYPRAAGNPR
ncbi:MAG: prephenate dehydratase [Proteobacteria bacterium]|nr:prephenate dehydratase [Pseudomonadota bacterium]